MSLFLWLVPLVIATSFLSGIFGMAGGMILMGVLVATMSVPTAMVLHAITQISANGWRAMLLYKHIRWRICLRYIAGLTVAALLFGFIRFIPSRPLVLMVLGLLPFISLALPPNIAPQADKRYGAEICGLLNGSVQFIAGVSGPLLDLFFVRSMMDRREVVATKAICQSLAHAAKLVYFGTLAGMAELELDTIIIVISIAAAAGGTTMSRFVLERMSDTQFRRWTRAIILMIGTVFFIQGVFTLARTGF